ncbi:hypothetical protein [Desemzia sp. FAM 23991]|uniref:hypothetical protein n=1 Tax=unclassified Desemzia TaxID=2685243 RepID=UPI003887DC5A
MSKKIKNKSLRIVFLILLCSLFVPNHTVHAYFYDVISENVGIELTLGSIDLDVKEDSNNSVLTLKSGQNKIQLKEVIQNKGTLTGKLAYKINLTKSDGGELDENLKNSIKITLNTQAANIQDSYELLSDESNLQIMLNPGSSIDVHIVIETTTSPEQSEEIKLQIEFLLFQTNGTLENPLFHDELTKVYDIILDKKETEKLDDYWPTSGWIDHGNIRYNKEKYSPVMYFSEMKDSQQIKNLNDNIFYVEIKDENGLELTDLAIRSPEDMIIKVEHVNDNKQHLKITISIDKTKFKRNILSVPIYDYSIAFNNGNNFELSEEDEPITLKRILLSTDEAGARTFNVRPINLFEEEREIYLAQTEQDNTGYLNQPLSKASFDNKPKITMEISGANKKLIDIKKAQIENDNYFTLKPKSKTATKETEMDLSIILEGTSGEILEVKRDIQILPTTSEAVWPQGMSTIWGMSDGKGNYKESTTSDIQVSNGSYVSTKNISIYVKNPYKDELQYIPPNSDKFTSQSIFYSPDGEYMKIDLKFSSNSLKEFPYTEGFNFTVLRESGIGADNMNYVPGQWAAVQFTLLKESKQASQNKLTVEQTTPNTEMSYEEQLLQAVTNGEKELYIEYTQLPIDFDVAKVEEDIRNIMANQGVEIEFLIEDDPELKAIKITVQE